MAAEELVLGLPRARIPGGASWRGVLYGDLDQWLDLVAREGTYRARREAEEDSSWKQVIPYLVLRDRGRLYLMRRTRAGSDARLHDRYSIGIGGHVNPTDGGLLGGLRREWSEEIDAAFDPGFRPIGIVNDDSEPVGSVHLGFVYVAEAHGRAVAVREMHKLKGEFVAPLQVLRVYDRLETWSSLVYDYLTARASGVHVHGMVPAAS